MNTRAVAILLVVLVMVTLSGGVLRHIEKSRHLGAPPLLMTSGEVLAEGGRLISTNTVALPDRILTYESKSTPITRVELEMLPRDTLFARRLYRAEDGFSLMLSVVMMGVDRSSIHNPRWCLDGQGYKIVKSDDLVIPLDDERRSSLPVRRLIGEKEVLQADGTWRNQRAIYVYWYVADGYVTAKDGDRMWWLARELVTSGKLQRWAYVAVLGACYPGGEEQTYQKIREFISASAPSYHQLNDSTVFSLPQ